MSKETNRVLGHGAEADGIEEYDNPLPDWWLGLFIGTIVWAFAYTIHYHVLADRSPVKALAEEMAAARERWPEAAPGVAAVPTDEESIHAGETIYQENCTGCHGVALQGGIGPSLVDSVWIHGGRPEDVAQVITMGVLEKGMPTWGPILGPEKIGRVAAYVVHQNHEALGIEDED